MDCVKCGVTLVDGAVYCHMCGKKQVATKRRRRKRANNMGTVFKHNGRKLAKPWEAQKNGVSIGMFATEHEAELALAKLADTNITDGFNMPFKEVYARWKVVHFKELTESGRSGYTTAYSHCEDLHDRAFRKIKKADFQKIINRLEDDGYSKSSCEKVIQLFNQLAKWAMDSEEICNRNYASGVRTSAKQKNEDDKFVFTEEHIKKILGSDVASRDVAIILISTGCRPIDLFTAKVTDCFDTHFISGSKTDAGKNRVIPVNKLGVLAYHEVLDRARERGAEKLIDGYDGNRNYKNFARRDWKLLMDDIGLSEVTPYACRRTYTTFAVKSEVQPEVLQKILGHAQYETTIKYYTHLDKDFIIKGSEKVTIAEQLQNN